MSSHLMYLSLFLPQSGPAVDVARKSLEADENKWFIRLLISSGIVALGCILEIWETWITLRRWWLLKYRSKEEPENLTSWNIPIAAVGLVLVIVGVIGESVYEGKLSTTDTELRSHDEQILGDAITQAGSAKDSAEVAAKSAEHATEAAASALNEAGRLESRVTGNAKDVKDIKAKQADRILTIKAADIDTLRGFGTVKSRVMVNTGNPEANVLADQINRLLGAADTKPFPVGQAMGSEDLLYERGVHIRTPDKYRGIAEALRKILDREKISVDVSPLTLQDEILVSERSNDILAILVGPK